ncbi:MAG TPA: SDR family NAD(P)-dependent oxidoreductase [Thermodesulfobacteriota bacterium]|nr:SDR family NAD(P)-dependent oxidoreductase [Thermodesulfobacteriota bacterium]
MAEKGSFDIREPKIKKEEILVVKDKYFHNKNVAIVTGASSGVGRATAIALAVNGLTVVGTDVAVEGGKETVKMAKELGGEVVFINGDLTKDQEIEEGVRKAAQHGSIKFLANIAGIQHIDAIDNFPMKTYDLMMSIMLRAPFYLSKLCIPHIKKSEDGIGAIGNMSSVHGHMVTKNKPVYNITKFGLRGLAQSIAAEGEGKIRGFSVSVGFVRTPLALNQIPEQAKQRGITPAEVVRDVMMGKSQIKEMMTPIEVGNLFVIGFSFLGKYLIGGDLLFDGGMVKTY